MTSRTISTSRHEDADVSWAFAACPPHPALAADVVGYVGYREHALRPVRRREVPSARVPVIISFGDTLRVSGLVDGAGAPIRLTSFVAGFSDTYAVTEYAGGQRGLQIDLTPLGAFRMLGLAGDELRSGSLELADVLGPSAADLVDQLVSAPDWGTRFGIVDTFLLRRAERARAVEPAIGWAWERIRRSEGQIEIGRLAADIGWSRRHFGDRFRHHVGLRPKAAARVLRFARAVRMLDGSRAISDVAADCGYADHSHLVHEVQEMAGCTPTDLMAERNPPPGSSS
ncbi:AraC family transcriptional regulator [Actinobacteria bacterium YIM 96077]|uniref:AraC family transcriptional regulator n=1 Tax=Phytoactinopolyspora halophila TaxID=1981511 RepID=A0A329QVJ0_9ACTN|nr:helix-turn-helix transcriptional regulator [Phytoactinopolyspora halophila]AYY12773.1 AraC family transcriptional regulator [Actinobacteria bacterium YIM 96077]RAW16434.1 AraC family transcriptional regulator [Phytoactinopolyspora halophila]